VSDLEAGDNAGFAPAALAVEASGQILITASLNVGGDALLRIDPATGTSTIVSDFGAGSDTHASGLYGIAVEANGQMLVAAAFTLNGGALFRVNPSTGARTILSDFGSGANRGISPKDVAIEATGEILVIASTLVIDDNTQHHQGVLF